jgi:hypothetical protein
VRCENRCERRDLTPAVGENPMKVLNAIGSRA